MSPIFEFDDFGVSQIKGSGMISDKLKTNFWADQNLKNILGRKCWKVNGFSSEYIKPILKWCLIMQNYNKMIDFRTSKYQTHCSLGSQIDQIQNCRVIRFDLTSFSLRRFLDIYDRLVINKITESIVKMQFSFKCF